LFLLVLKVSCLNMLIYLFSFRFLLDISMTLDFFSLKLILLFFDHADILLISRFDIFYAALIVSHLTAKIKSSANATVFVGFVNWMFRR
jgi:hypothetical protein